VEGIERVCVEPGERYFQVKTKDNRLFRLCYNESQDHWSLAEVVRG
jgi:hypothetical protein